MDLVKTMARAIAMFAVMPVLIVLMILLQWAGLITKGVSALWPKKKTKGE